MIGGIQVELVVHSGTSRSTGTNCNTSGAPTIRIDISMGHNDLEDTSSIRVINTSPSRMTMPERHDLLEQNGEESITNSQRQATGRTETEPPGYWMPPPTYDESMGIPFRDLLPSHMLIEPYGSLDLLVNTNDRARINRIREELYYSRYLSYLRARRIAEMVEEHNRSDNEVENVNNGQAEEIGGSMGNVVDDIDETQSDNGRDENSAAEERAASGERRQRMEDAARLRRAIERRNNRHMINRPPDGASTASQTRQQENRPRRIIRAFTGNEPILANDATATRDTNETRTSRALAVLFSRMPTSEEEERTNTRDQ